MARKAQIIPPQTDLKRRAVNTSRGFSMNPSAKELAKIEEVVNKSTDRFVKQAAEKLKRLRQGLISASENADLQAAFLRQVREESLSIKGLGGMFNFPLMTEIGKSLNDFVERKPELRKVQLEIVRLHIDALYVILANKIEGAGSERELQVISAFRIAVAKFS